MLKNILFLILLTILLAACTQESSPPPAAPTADPLTTNTMPKPVEITTKDSTVLKGTYYPSETIKSNAPGLLLIHMANSNQEVWKPFAKAAQQAGYAILTLDLRGHGESGGNKYNYLLMDQDVEAGLNWMQSRPEINGDKIGIAGASIGANLGLQLASKNPKVKSVVLLSPGLNYDEITTIDALSSYGQRPVMFVAAEKDTYAADSVRTLNSQALGQHQMQIYPGTEHGTDIFLAQAGLQPMMLAWFGTTIN